VSENDNGLNLWTLAQVFFLLFLLFMTYGNYTISQRNQDQILNNKQDIITIDNMYIDDHTVLLKFSNYVKGIKCRKFY
jgi:hypothetical protein